MQANKIANKIVYRWWHVALLQVPRRLKTAGETTSPGGREDTEGKRIFDGSSYVIWKVKIFSRFTSPAFRKSCITISFGYSVNDLHPHGFIILSGVIRYHPYADDSIALSDVAGWWER